jgi:hypothetical protein
MAFHSDVACNRRLCPSKQPVSTNSPKAPDFPPGAFAIHHATTLQHNTRSIATTLT